MVGERNQMSRIRLTPCYESRPWCWAVNRSVSGREASHRPPPYHSDPDIELGR